MEATPSEAAEGLAIVRVLAAVLDRLVCANAAIARSDPGQVTKFHAMKAPGIGILPYLERVHKYASCSNECFIMALIYIDRLIQSNNFLLTELNVHRVVITAVLLAAKFFDDAYYNNAYYAKVGGVLCSEMNGLEVDFLFRINFSLVVTPAVFDKYRAELVMHSAATVVPTSPANLVVVAPSPPMDPIPVQPQQTICGVPTAAAAHPPGLHHSTVETLRAVAAATAAAAAVTQQITPSPPAEARRCIAQCPSVAPPAVQPPAADLQSQLDFIVAATAAVGNPSFFPPMQRANSMPVNSVPAKSPSLLYYNHHGLAADPSLAAAAAFTQQQQQQQCALSAPPIIQQANPQAADPYLVVDPRHLFLQSALPGLAVAAPPPPPPPPPAAAAHCYDHLYAAPDYAAADAAVLVAGQMMAGAAGM